MGKIERKYLAHFINATPTDEATYERLGKDLEEYSTELSPEVDTKRNIIGETSVTVSGYDVSSTVEPFYAEEGSKLFDFLQDIVDDRKVLDDVVTDAIEVHMWEPSGGTQDDTSFVAYKEDVHIAITSYGGDYTGYQIPFEIHYTGKRTKGTFDTATRKFAPGA